MAASLSRMAASLARAAVLRFRTALVRLFLYPPILFPDACPGSVKFEPVQALCCPMLFCSSWSRAEGLESLTAHQSVTSQDSRECVPSRDDGDTTHKPCHTCAPLHQTCAPSCLGVPPVVPISNRFILGVFTNSRYFPIFLSFSFKK